MAPERESHCAIRSHPEQQERQGRLREWMVENGVKAVLFDLDDTLLSTSPLIRELEDRYVTYVVSQQPTLSPHEVLDTLRREDTAVFMSHSVSKARWSALAHRLGHVYGPETDDAFHKGLAIFMSLYSTVPRMLPGAQDTVQTFRCAADRMGVVTHADEYWTGLKLHKTGLSTFFDQVYVVPDDDHKNEEHWGKAIKQLGVKPHEVLVIGDSISGDITAAARAGVKHLILVPSQWSPYGAGVVPEGVISVSGIDRVVDTLIGTLQK